MKHDLFLFLLSIGLLLGGSVQGAIAPAKKTVAAKPVNDSKAYTGIERETRSVEDQISKLSTDDHQLDTSAKMSANDRESAIHDITEGIKRIEDSLRSQKLTSAHLKLVEKHLHDFKEYLANSSKMLRKN